MKEAHDFFNDYRSGMLSGLNTCALARIERYDPKLMQADITRLDKPEAAMIMSCPVSTQQTKDFIIRTPYQVGDIVVAVFSQRDIEPVLFEGGEPAKETLREDDAIVIGGINLFTQPLDFIPTEHDEDLVIAHKAFNYRIIGKPDGTVNVVSEKEINMRAPQINLNGGVS